MMRNRSSPWLMGLAWLGGMAFIIWLIIEMRSGRAGDLLSNPIVGFIFAAVVAAAALGRLLSRMRPEESDEDGPPAPKPPDTIDE